MPCVLQGVLNDLNIISVRLRTLVLRRGPSYGVQGAVMYTRGLKRAANLHPALRFAAFPHRILHLVHLI